MEHKFKYKLKTRANVMDYSEQRKQYHVRRWLEENPPYMDDCGILERYEVCIMVEGKIQLAEFIVDDLTEAS